MKLADIEPSVLEAIACLDGAVVVDLNGRLITFGAILRIAPEIARAGQGRPGRTNPGRPRQPRSTGPCSRSVKTAT